MDSLIDTITSKKYKVEIHCDQDAESPRDWSNSGKIVMSHSDYNFPWECEDIARDDCKTMQDYLKEVEKQGGIVLPIYLYDHSGLSLSTNRDYPFNCPWDSGQVGYIYITKEDMKRENQEILKMNKEDNIKRTKISKKEFHEYLVNEVKVFSQYLSGDVYGFVIEMNDDYEPKHIIKTCKTCGVKSKEYLEKEEALSESCWGYYDHDESLKEYIKDHITDKKELKELLSQV